MYAVVKIGGQQYKVKKDDQIFVYHLGGTVGDKVEFSEVLMVNTDGNLSFNKGLVKAEIVDVVKGDKVIAFKMKRRKGFRKKLGFRQTYSKIRIEDIQ